MRLNVRWLNPIKTLAILTLALLMGCASESDAPTSEPVDSTPTSIPVDEEIRIDPLNKRQIIEGFGASGAWWAQDVGGWEDESREQIIKLLFDQQEGIGLSIYRYNIGGGDGENIPDNWRRAETFEVAQGADKHRIKLAVEKAFKVNVVAVNVMTVPGKTRRVGRRQITSSPWRKAVVTLKAGQKIELFEGV